MFFTLKSAYDYCKSFLPTIGGKLVEACPPVWAIVCSISMGDATPDEDPSPPHPPAHAPALVVTAQEEGGDPSGGSPLVARAKMGRW